MFEPLEPRVMLTSNWHNSLNPLDVSADADGSVTFHDAVFVVRELAETSYSDPDTGLLVENHNTSKPYVDVDCDGYVSPIDALRILNRLFYGAPTQAKAIGNITNAAFPKWTTFESGGSVQPGDVQPQGCGVLLTEGDSFHVGMQADFTIPASPSALQFTLGNINFDAADAAHINDALEIAILDESGNALTETFVSLRDAAFNLTEGLSTQFGRGVLVQDNLVTIGLNGLPAGQQSNIVVRLINNDQDTGTAVELTEVKLVPSDLPAVRPLQSFQRAQVRETPLVLADNSVASRAIASSTAELNSAGEMLLSLRAEVPRAVVAPHTPLVVSGQVVLGPAATPDTFVERITVTGHVVDAVDATGRFFSAIDVLPGDNQIAVTAYTNTGQSVSTSLTIIGLQQTSEDDLAALDQLSLEPEYGRTSLDDVNDVLYTDLAIRNAYKSPLGRSLYVGFADISSPDITVLDPDAYSPEGMALFRFDTLSGDGRLLPAQNTNTRSIGFHNPNQQPFDFDLLYWGTRNRPPEFTSIPVVQIGTEQAYEYQLLATDPDDDFVTYRLKEFANNAVLDEGGILVWQPTKDDIGTHRFTVEASDPFGAVALQTFVVSVTDTLPNRPPVITSRPETTVSIDDVSIDASAYEYQVVANDPDHDTLTYALGVAPPGMAIDRSTGLIQWNPEATQTGNHDVEIEVSDGRGGRVAQRFTLCVHADPANHPPVIVSLPPQRIIASPTERTGFSYDVDAIDPDNDQLTFSLDAQTAPAGMFVDPRTGLLLWNVPAGTVGEQAVTITVDDGHGGWDEQSFVLDIDASGSGIIRGTKFEDTNDNGKQDTATLDLPPAVVDAGTAEPRFPFTLETDLKPNDRVRAVISGTVEFNNNNGANYSADWNAAGIVVRRLGTRLTVGQTDHEFIDMGWLRLAIGNNDMGFFPLLEPVEENGLGSRTPPESLILDRPASEIFDIPGFEGLPAGTRLFYRIFDFPTDDNEGAFRVSPLEEPGGDVTELGLPGWQIYIDDNNDGQRNNGERFTFTDGNGGYVFTGLPAGDYIVREEQRSNWIHTVPESGVHLVTVADTAIDDVDFGNRRLDPANLPPTMSAALPDSVVVNQLFRFDVAASDPNNDSVTFTLPLAPDGMTIHPKLGTILWLPNESQLGDHELIIHLSDERGGTAFDSFSIHVDEPNTPPVFTSTPIESAIAGQSYTSRILTQDAETSAVDIRLEEAPDGMTLTSANLLNAAGDLVERLQTIEWVVPQSAVGTIESVTLIATDADGEEARQQWEIRVLDPATQNTAPVITATTPATARIGAPWNYLVDATDADGEVIAFSLANQTPGMEISADGLITWTPSEASPDHVQVTITARDTRGADASLDLNVPVTSIATNRSPSITSTPRAVAIAGDTFTYDANAIDPEGDATIWQLASSPRGMSIDPHRGSIRWTPTDQEFGTHHIVLTATDPFLGIATQEFDIHVGCANSAPAIVSLPPTLAFTDTAYVYAPRADDPENDLLTWQLLQAPAGMTIDTFDGVIRWQPQAGQIGSHVVVVDVADGHSNASQSFEIVVEDKNALLDPDDPSKGIRGNQPPTITSTPNFSADTVQLYQYFVTANDPDGDPITLALEAAPEGLSLEQATLSWTPSLGDIGDYVVTISAADDRGATSWQTYLLSVRENHPPTIASLPPLTVTAGTTYRYAVVANDVDADPLTYQLNSAPDDMTIDSNGILTWSTEANIVQSQQVELTVSDSRQGAATQQWTINVLADTEPPTVSVEVLDVIHRSEGQPNIDVGTEFSVRVRATDNVGLTDVNLFVDNEPVLLNSFGLATIFADELGSMLLNANATDAAGLVGTSQETVRIVDPADRNKPVPTDPTLPDHPGFDPSDNGRPIVVISSPELGASITTAVPIIGTVDDPEDNLWYYRVYYSRADRASITQIQLDDPDWIILKEGTQEIIDGELAVFDPSLLGNNAYVVVVAAYDVNGQGYAYPTTFFVEGNVQLGNFRLEFTDLSIPLAGIPIEI
ncbi:MAG: hypothetical protein KDB27_09180, partial [Planctomycetales bacterium]|nr:hypothetical protein [Planctomycetales bacterium]